MKKIIVMAALIAGFVNAPVFAEDESNVSAGLTAAGAPLGLHGVDPVAFIDIGNRLEGSAQYSAVHDGVAYYFDTENNKNKFAKNPQKYIPQNGGFCTYGVSVGKKFDGDPQYADIIDGKLYVFLNEAIFSEYRKSPKATIVAAQKQWKKIKHTAANSL